VCDWLLQVWLIRWLLVIIDCLEAGTLETLRNLYQFVFLLLDFALLVHILVVISAGIL